MGAAFGAMPHLSAVEPDLAAPTAVIRELLLPCHATPYSLAHGGMRCLGE